MNHKTIASAHGIVACAILLVGCEVPMQAGTSQAMRCGFTEISYGQLRTELSIAQVTQLTGCNGNVMATSNTAGVGQVVMIRWNGPGSEESTLTFVNGGLYQFIRSPGLFQRVGPMR